MQLCIWGVGAGPLPGALHQTPHGRRTVCSRLGATHAPQRAELADKEPRIAALAERLRRTYSGKGASMASIRTVFFSAALPAELTWCLMIPSGYALGLGCLCNHV